MKRVTLLDVAQHAGVSRAAASLVVRGTGRISEATRARVRASMVELGYVYHRGAASLRTRSSGVVGMVITDISNPSFAKLALGFEQRMGAAGLFTMLGNTFDAEAREASLLQSMIEHPVDAIVYVPAADESDVVKGLLEAAPMPVLSVTRRSSATESHLGPDNLTGGFMSAEHLAVVHGCRRVAYLGGPAAGSARRDRVAGAMSALARQPDSKIVLDVPGAVTPAASLALAEAVLSSDVEFDGVIAHSDLTAYAFYRVLRDSGGRMAPVIGFDDLPTSVMFEPAVTSVAVEDFGARTAERLLALMNGGPAYTELVTPTLLVRASCGCQAPCSSA